MLPPGTRYSSATAISLAEGWSLERLTPPSRLFGANGLRTGPESVATAEGGRAIISSALEAYGRIDVLIHNAGIVRYGSLQEMTYEDFDAVLDVHLRGAFHVVRPAFPLMRQAGYGRIVLTSSVGGLYGSPRVASYGTAKAGIGAARQPILLVGHAVHTSRAGAAVKALADAMACPVIQTSGGTSYISGLEDRTFPYGFSPAAIDAVVKSDLCLAIGTELGEPVHYGRGRHWVENEANRRWILVEQDPAAIGVNRPVDVPLVGDLRAIVPQLADALAESPRTASPELADWIQADAARLAELAVTAPSGMSPVHPARLIVEATKVFPADWRWASTSAPSVRGHWRRACTGARTRAWTRWPRASAVTANVPNGMRILPRPSSVPTPAASRGWFT